MVLVSNPNQKKGTENTWAYFQTVGCFSYSQMHKGVSDTLTPPAGWVDGGEKKTEQSRETRTSAHAVPAHEDFWEGLWKESRRSMETGEQKKHTVSSLVPPSPAFLDVNVSGRV